MNLQPISIIFDQTYSNKIRVIQEAISDPTTHRQVVEGLLDVGYANALKTLHQDGRINTASFKQNIKDLPEHLQGCINL